MKINEIICEDVSQGDFALIERFADALWGRLGVDVKFTWHFMQRVNDERNGKPITTAELIRMFKKEYMKYGKNVADMDNSVEAVFKDAMTAINLPFVIKDTPQGKELIAKTTMRKPNFKTRPGQPTYVIDDVNLPKDQWETLISTADKESLVECALLLSDLYNIVAAKNKDGKKNMG
jgi:hypothetical protein